MQEFHDSTPNDVVRYPMVPIRDVVVFPHTKAAFVIGRASSVLALEEALATNRIIFLATQHDATVEDPQPEDIYSVGTLAYIANSLRKPDEATIKVLVEGRERARAMRVEEHHGVLMATLRRAPLTAESTRRSAPLVTRVAALGARRCGCSGARWETRGRRGCPRDRGAVVARSRRRAGVSCGRSARC